MCFSTHPRLSDIQPAIDLLIADSPLGSGVQLLCVIYVFGCLLFASVYRHKSSSTTCVFCSARLRNMSISASIRVLQSLFEPDLTDMDNQEVRQSLLDVSEKYELRPAKPKRWSRSDRHLQLSEFRDEPDEYSYQKTVQTCEGHDGAKVYIWAYNRVFRAMFAFCVAAKDVQRRCM
ncbi:hypothetical protein L596_011910 [Steinernema carpocapsae]|uniref:Uncharacterized protein n=1 Tax=Steinernema carpocapsae TaxID=34508 RepID=A0A4U5NVQ2_STECR|nr:hypothetical protein L596_011910 [Steinernema carpocapsae]